MNKVDVVIASLKELGQASIQDLHKYMLKKYGITVSPLDVILDVLKQLGFVHTLAVNGKTYYVFVEEPRVAQEICVVHEPKLEPEVSRQEVREEPKQVKPATEEDLRKKKYNIIVDRDYNWNNYIPDGRNLPEYIPQRDELKKLEVSQRLRVEGPPGCGKTLMVEWYCYKKGIPLFPIQGHGAKVTELIGTPWIVEDTAFWVDGILIKALLCSQKRKCVLMVDEFNRMDPYEQATFLSVADYRCQITIPITSEVIRGNPDNLKIVLTMNVGTEYFVHKLDDAIRRRFPCIKLDFLGLVNPELEVQAIMKQTGINRKLAELMVEVANKIRRAAKTERSPIQKGIPTHNVIEWARLALGYKKMGIPNAVLEAAMDTIVSYYDDMARIEVEQIIKNYIDDGELIKKGYWK